MPRSKASKASGDGAEPPAGESIDQVRDLLFGAQMRTVDDRLAQLEKRFQAELNELAKEVAGLEKATTKRDDSLDSKIKAERAKRTDALKDLRADMRDGLKTLTNTVGKLEESTSKSDAELRDMVLQAVDSLSKQIDALSKKLSADLASTADRLDHDKADRLTLSELFASVSEHLGDESEAAKG